MTLETDRALARVTFLPEESRKIILPHSVDFWPKTRDLKSWPYEIQINATRFGEFLSEMFELPEERIRNIDIHVLGEGKLGLPDDLKRDLRGSMRNNDGVTITPPDKRGRQSIVIFARTFWAVYKKEKKLIMHYLKSDDRASEVGNLLGRPMSTFYVDDALLRHLDESDNPSMLLDFLASMEILRDLLRAIGHEGAHAFADNIKDLNGHAISRKFLGKIPRKKPARYTSEDLARMMELEVIENPKWHDLAKFELVRIAA